MTLSNSTIWQKFNQFFRDKAGRLTLSQTPNVPLASWLLLTVLEYFTHGQHIASYFALFAFASLFTWAYLEIRQGTSQYRKVLGSVVMLALILLRTR